MSVGEVAGRLGVSKSAVYRMVHRGKLPGIRLGDHRNIRVPEAAVEKMVMEMQEHSDPA
ncbi:helix-turn-helix domain-containing protein [Streptomyces sp. NPDC029006]|uniref:helix-turn-helix domain-containing protein n=1 Tax=Streptomyces sp. NPDC029006 TaxID=3155467 RepID=UPI00340F5D04